MGIEITHSPKYWRMRAEEFRAKANNCERKEARESLRKAPWPMTNWPAALSKPDGPGLRRPARYCQEATPEDGLGGTGLFPSLVA